MPRETINNAPSHYAAEAMQPFPIGLDGGVLLVPYNRDVNRRARAGGAWSREQIPSGNTWQSNSVRVQPWSDTPKDHGPIRWAYREFDDEGTTNIWEVGAATSEVETESWYYALGLQTEWTYALSKVGSELFSLQIREAKPFAMRRLAGGIKGVWTGTLFDVSDKRLYAAPWAVINNSEDLLLFDRPSFPINADANIATDLSESTTDIIRRFHAVADDDQVGSLWVGYLSTGNELKLYRRSNLTTYTGSLPTQTTSATWDQLLIARMPGGVGICLIDKTIVGGRPNIQACFWSESDGTFGNWVRIETNTDWGGSDDFEDQVCWQHYPSDASIRLAVARFTSGTDYLYLYEEMIANQPPTAPPVTDPISGSVRNTAQTLRIAWMFSDPNDDDTQSAYEIRRTIGSTVEYRTASGWQTPSDASSKMGGATSSLTLPSNWGNATDVDHFYAVRTWDAADVSGPWSADIRVVPSTPPTRPVITSPADGDTISDSPLTVTWTGAHQDAYRVRTGSGTGGNISTVISDTGEIGSALQTIDIPIDSTPTSLIIEVRIYNTDGLQSATRTITITVNLTPPKVVTVIPAADNAQGLIGVAFNWTSQPGDAPDVADVWRREGTDPTTEIRVAANIAEGTADWDDYLARSGVDYEYRTTSRKGNITAQSPWVG